MIWKIGIAAVAMAAAGTTAAVVIKSRSDSGASASSTSVTSVEAVKPTVPPAPQAVPHPAAATPALPRPAGLQTVTPDDDDQPRLIGKGTIAKLKLDKGPSRGPANAPVTIILFQDLLCKYCGTVLGTIDEIWDEYPGKLRLVVKQLPVHSQAVLAAEASLAAEAQGKFWELHDVMIANQDDLSRDAIIGYARQAGLDVAKMTRALDEHQYQGALAQEMDAAKEIGVQATPTFLINGEEVQGARPADAFKAAIDEALAAAKR